MIDCSDNQSSRLIGQRRLMGYDGALRTYGFKHIFVCQNPKYPLGIGFYQTGVLVDFTGVLSVLFGNNRVLGGTPRQQKNKESQ